MKRRKTVILYGLLSLVLLLAACAKDSVQPVAINEDTDTCDICNMAVMDGEHATQILLKGGKSLVFDDIGCMYEWLKSNEDEEVTGKFVRDFNDKEWVEVDDATFIYNESVKTPMAYNIISFKDKNAAEQFAEENDGSVVMTANDLPGHSWERNKEMMMQNKMEHHSHNHDEQDDHDDHGDH